MIPVIFRRFFLWTTVSLSVILFTRFMLILTLWQEEQVYYDANTQMWSNVIYMPCTAENNFVPEFPKENPDIIYLCLPNNPTGTTTDQGSVAGMG